MKERTAWHILLQLLILTMTINIALDGEAKLCRRVEDVVTLAGYVLLFNCAIYFNLLVLLPRYLERKRYGRYAVGILCTIVFLLVGIMAVQTCLAADNGMETLETPFLMALNLASSILCIALMLGGSSTFLLLRRWAGDRERVSELEHQNLLTELTLLKQQINPHFLFNTLNNANVLLMKNPHEASRLLFKLEELLRYQMEGGAKERVPLSSDIRFLGDYLNLEKVRRDHFDFSISVEGDTDGITLPPMLFIPFVENAVKHNPDCEHLSYVRLAFKIQETRHEIQETRYKRRETRHELCFNCINSISKDFRGTGVGGIGLKNIVRRLELLYPDKHTLQMEETEAKYTVNLRLTLTP